MNDFCQCRVMAHAVVVGRVLVTSATRASCVMNALTASMSSQMTTAE